MKPVPEDHPLKMATAVMVHKKIKEKQKDAFNPDRQFIQDAVKEFLQRGKKIKVIKRMPPLKWSPEGRATDEFFIDLGDFNPGKYSGNDNLF